MPRTGTRPRAAVAALCSGPLRRYGRSIGVEPGFTILDRGDAEDLIALVRSQLGLNEKDKRFPRKGTIMEMISKSENTLRSLEEIILDEFGHFADHIEDLTRLKTAYQAAKRQKQLLDYDDLLVMLRQLLLLDETARMTISRQFRYILVDEYQDTNRLQAEVVRKLAATHNNVMVVGDDSQSIYAFRGATFKNIMEFPQLFPGTQIYKLEENYRSTQPILNLANCIIDEAAEKYTKRLFTRKIDGPLPSLVEAARAIKVGRTDRPAPAAQPDMGPIFSGYVGLALFGSAFLAVGLLASSVTSNQILSAVLGLGLLLLCIAKVFFYDLRNLETFYRILSFIGLGLILLAVSWVYTRFQEQVRKLL